MAAKHGQLRRMQTQEPEYWCWVRMRRRCYQPRYKGYHRYGGRGITVCDRWRNDYFAFLADMGRMPSRKHSLDRINNDGNYEPGNVRWATDLEQKNNRSNCIRITFRNRTQTLAQWSRELGVDRGTLKSRLDRLTTEEAFALSRKAA